VRIVVALVVVLSAIASRPAWWPWDRKLDAAAVEAMCRASRDASGAEHRAGRDFQDALAASRRDGWSQSLPVVGERRASRVAERERWRRLSTELIAAARQRTFAAGASLGTAGGLADMRAEAVRLKDDAGITALDGCQRDADGRSRALDASAPVSAPPAPPRTRRGRAAGG